MSDARPASDADEGLRREPVDRTRPPEEMVVPRTRTSSTFVMAVVGLVLALLMLVFVLQNDSRQDFEFLWLDFTLPTGVAMLLAAVVGGLIVALLGLGRMLQVRLAARRHRDADRLRR
jgi:uncharacterized integral membrane protein